MLLLLRLFPSLRLDPSGRLALLLRLFPSLRSVLSDLLHLLLQWLRLRLLIRLLRLRLSGLQSQTQRCSLFHCYSLVR